MTLRLQNKTEIVFTHPEIGSMCSFIKFKSENDLKNAIKKDGKINKIMYNTKKASINICFSELQENMIFVVIDYKVNNIEYVHKYSCTYNNKLKDFLCNEIK
jgi:hypothetical protein